MLFVSAHPFELRGVSQKVSKKGNVYFVGHFEDSQDYLPCQFMLGGDYSKLGENPKKGDLYYLTFEFNTRFKELRLLSCSKVEAE